mmetsp:Transcript_18582/g.74169  ORF Transcript_18582/g.74169 Transcript_18582/m.74169 type:complete len:120 (+) Transcript_18582:94-453(+)
MGTQFDPKKTKINEDTFADWLREPIQASLQQVPGIGPAAEKLLAEPADAAEEKIETTHQLIGKFLTMKGADVTPVEHCDMFFTWLGERGIKVHKHTIVNAIAEKCEVFVPGVYDAAAYL